MLEIVWPASCAGVPSGAYRQPSEAPAAGAWGVNPGIVSFRAEWLRSLGQHYYSNAAQRVWRVRLSSHGSCVTIPGVAARPRAVATFAQF